MKQRPNISVHKNEKLINYVKTKVLSDLNGTFQSGSAQDFNNDLQLHNDLVRNNPLPSTYVAPKGKTKSKPNVKLIKRDIGKTNQFRIDMLNYANREFGINPDLLIEYSTYYVLTIISYKLITNNEQPTAKDFDIYCNGLLIDKTTYDVNVNENIVITIQKNEAVDDNFDETNFEIVSKFDWINITNEEDFDLTTENGEDIIL
jgi:hypothetical protein